VAWDTFIGERNCRCGECAVAPIEARFTLCSGVDQHLKRALIGEVGPGRHAGTGHRETLTLPWPDSYSSTSESFQHKLHRINWVGDVPA
jgi:hypothetical protein